MHKMHLLQPKHLKLSPKDIKELFAKYNISSSQLPVIKITDPALPKDAKTGDIIKIERKAKNGEKTHYYRIVVG